MALITCPECGKEISDKSTVCVHCGFYNKKYVQNEIKEVAIKRMGCGCLIFILGAFILLFLFGC